jgi:hypothetical protein
MKKLILILLFPITVNAQLDYIEAITFQNGLRSYFEIPFLEYDPLLADDAQQWADHIAITDDFSVSNSVYGETIYSFNKAYYNPNINYFLDAVVHWTIQDEKYPFYQMVYPETTRVGFGISENNNSIFVVAKYDKAWQ